MATLNRKASELMQEVEAHACTDVTGFGFIGHAYNLVQQSKVGIKVHSDNIPFFAETKEFSQKGFFPGGLRRNAEFYSPMVAFANHVPQYMKDILFDPQTSGGLLIVVAAKSAQDLLSKLHNAGVKDAAIVGEVVNEPVGKILVE